MFIAERERRWMRGERTRDRRSDAVVNSGARSPLLLAPSKDAVEPLTPRRWSTNVEGLPTPSRVLPGDDQNTCEGIPTMTTSTPDGYALADKTVRRVGYGAMQL